MTEKPKATLHQTPPRVFLSYSWTSPEHREFIRQCADRLLSDGVEVILDVYDLQEGDDKNAFMEGMVTDDSVSHVLVFCDKAYADKANAREAGVGTESQIISENVYKAVKQSKFIPIACEFDDNGTPYLPAFFQSRIYIDFSSPEALNKNWEQLVRLLFGKPLHKKPRVGKPPVYVTASTPSPIDSAATKFPVLRQAILRQSPETKMYRAEFLDACFEFADSLRVRKAPDAATLGEKIVADCGTLKYVRNNLVDWILAEVGITPRGEFDKLLVVVLERLRELKSRPAEINGWNDSWFDAHSVFVYESFLYIIASLLKTEAYLTLHHVFSSHYVIPEVDRHGDNYFEKFDCFYGHSKILNDALAPEGRVLFSPAAELIKRQADREDLPFDSLVEAEALILLMVFLVPDTNWYPGTLHYAGLARILPFFLQATRHSGFRNLATITGIDTADALRTAASSGQERVGAKQWHNFRFSRDFLGMMNLDRLDTLK